MSCHLMSCSSHGTFRPHSKCYMNSNRMLNKNNIFVFISGIAVAGSGIGGFVFPPLVEFLIATYSWRGTLLILGGVMLNIVLCGALFRPIVAFKKQKQRRKVSKIFGTFQSSQFETSERRRSRQEVCMRSRREAGLHILSELRRGTHIPFPRPVSDVSEIRNRPTRARFASPTEARQQVSRSYSVSQDEQQP